MSLITTQVILFNERPVGMPTENTFRYETIQIPATPPPGQMLLKLKKLSVDPYLRSRLRKGMPLNIPLVSLGICEVIESNNDKFKKGQFISGAFKWQTFQLNKGVRFQDEDIRIIDTTIKVPLSAWLGVLGMPGRTGYFGLLDDNVGHFRPGQTVLVSTAGGAVGSFVGQLARAKGAKRVIGTAGGPEKCKIVKEKYGFDECFDYKQLDTTRKMLTALKLVCPDGIDLYFDNTGGHVTWAALQLLNKFGRVAVCGNATSYNEENPAKQTIPNILGGNLIYGSHHIVGFVQGDFTNKFNQFYAEVPQLVASGKIKFDETVYHGFEKVPEAFIGLLSGKNTGKVIVSLDD